MPSRSVPALVVAAAFAGAAHAQFLLVDDYRDVNAQADFSIPGDDLSDGIYYTADYGQLFSRDDTIGIDHPLGQMSGHVVHTSSITPSRMEFSTFASVDAFVEPVQNVRMMGYSCSAATVTFMVDEPTTMRFQGETGDAYVTLYDYAKDYLVLEFYFDTFDTTYDLVPGVLYEIGFGGCASIDDSGSGENIHEEISTSLTISVDGAPEPCAPDLAAPMGVLNFFDIQAFITAFNAMQPIADLAAPFGVFNFFDIQAYITSFNAGCP